MTDIVTLAALGRGEKGRVRSLQNPLCMRRRLLDLGLVEGTEVACVGCSPGGGMNAYLIRGAVIALRSSDCKNVLIDRMEGCHE